MSKSQFAFGSIRILLATMLFAGAALGTEMPPARDPEPSKEMREKMAATHDAMAARFTL